MTIITMKKLSRAVLIILAFAVSMTIGHMWNHSASAKTNLNSLHSSVTSAVGLSAQISGLPIFALGANNNTLYLLAGSTFNRIGPISSVNGTLRECDFRPANNQLYCVTDTGSFYVVNTANASVIPSFTSSLNNPTSQLLDIDPVTDAFRWVGTDDSNYAIVNGRLVVLRPFAYVANDVNAGVNPNLVAGAHDNNQNGQTTTTFIMFDSGTNQAVVEYKNAAASSNVEGQLVTIGGVFDQNGRVTITPNSGFDITTSPQNGLNVGVLLTTGKLSFLYTDQIPKIVTPGQIQNLSAFSQGVVGSDGNNQWADVMIPIQQ